MFKLILTLALGSAAAFVPVSVNRAGLAPQSASTLDMEAVLNDAPGAGFGENDGCWVSNTWRTRALRSSHDRTLRSSNDRTLRSSSPRL